MRNRVRGREEPPQHRCRIRRFTPAMRDQSHRPPAVRIIIRFMQPGRGLPVHPAARIPRAVLRGTSAFLILLLAAGGATAQVTPLVPVITADDTTFDITTGEAVLRGHPRIVYGPTLLLADELHYNQAGSLVIASGHFSITSGPASFTSSTTSPAPTTSPPEFSP